MFPLKLPRSQISKTTPKNVDLLAGFDRKASSGVQVLVLLAIRALGKSKFVLCQVPTHKRRPESAVLRLGSMAGGGAIFLGLINDVR